MLMTNTQILKWIKERYGGITTLWTVKWVNHGEKTPKKPIHHENDMIAIQSNSFINLKCLLDSQKRWNFCEDCRDYKCGYGKTYYQYTVKRKEITKEILNAEGFVADPETYHCATCGNTWVVGEKS